MFKTIKHSKIKNTGLIYLLLIRQIITLGINNKEVKSLNIFKTYFKKQTDLYKLLLLYRMLKLTRFNSLKKADLFVLKILLFRKRLDNKKLKTLKYNCLKLIMENYDIKELFSVPIPEYKLYASIYKLFLSAIDKNMYNPTNIILSRYNITSQLISDNTQNKINSDDILQLFKKQSKEIKAIAFKQLIKKYNLKYKILNEDQRSLLKLYINNITNHKIMALHIHKSIPMINTRIKNILLNLDLSDLILKIKLTLVKTNIRKIDTIKSLDDKIYTVLNIYLLLKLILTLEK